MEAEVRHSLLTLSNRLDRYERLAVTSRIKDCESALEGLRRRQEAATFDPNRADSYTLTDLNDLAGVRVLAFPRSRWIEAHGCLRQCFSSWTSDPIREDEDDMTREPLAFKYYGYCSASTTFHAELQVVPMLIGLFWEIEHSAIYKPSPELKGVAASLEMKERRREVYQALKGFETEFERLVQRDPLKKP